MIIFSRFPYIERGRRETNRGNCSAVGKLFFSIGQSKGNYIIPTSINYKQGFIKTTALMWFVAIWYIYIFLKLFSNIQFDMALGLLIYIKMVIFVNV